MIHQKVPLRDPDGAILKWFGSSIDIEDRKRAENNLKWALAENKTLKEQLFRENIALRDEIDKASMFEEIVGVSPALNAVLARLAKVAPTDSTVLITGETGTGKELIASASSEAAATLSVAFGRGELAAAPAI